MILNDAVRALLDARNYAVLCTTNPDGSPQSSVLWVARDGDDLLFSTLRDRRKELNLRRDPRASVTVFDLADPESYAEIRGTTTITEDVGLVVGHRLSRKYTGQDHALPAEGQVRVVLRVTPTKVTGHVA
ncbi:PPOX class F420-dependent oxidoreductase [Umezawaea tangerina]|uniref:PPOX class probable F420-dependent enzyme n=1 Tax=Umezawaea tangerina TaxID=84725 RepID=A0A2T0TKY4_9PSEU|nr:PPOX class probable F420-dependent enzyme [Umezawaea tangerina]